VDRYGNSVVPASNQPHISVEAQAVDLVDKIQTVSDFERFWRQCESDALSRCRFLLALDPALLTKVFKVDIKSTLLTQLLLALATGRSDIPDAASVHGKVLLVLQALASAGRFQLSVKLLPKQVKSAVRQMCEELVSCSQSALTDDERIIVLGQYS
jgi:Potential Monad-binding region of RPAP3